MSNISHKIYNLQILSQKGALKNLAYFGALFLRDMNNCSFY
jgi:hypothetical protein